MSVIGSNIIAGASGTVETGYQIARSLRFNSADSAYLARTPAGVGTSLTTWTYSCWVKRSALGSNQALLAAGTDANDYFNFELRSDETLKITTGENGTTNNNLAATVAVFRDLSAWYHIVLQWDMTNATSADRIKIYVNSVRQTLTGTIAAQNYTGTRFNRAFEHCIGRNRASVGHYSGYIADAIFIDGQALTPSSFGETDSATGVWVPKTYTGTYGTNGFWLKLDDNSGTTATTLGKDSSGNGNNWTPNNFSVTAGVGNDSLVDSPTNYGTDTGAGGEVRGNYATLNPLAIGQYASLSNGNLDIVGNSATNSGGSLSTLGFASGKYYYEFTVTSTTQAFGGVVTYYPNVVSNLTDENNIFGATGTNKGIGIRGSGTTYGNAAEKQTISAFTFATTDVIGVAIDADNGAVYFSKNGTWLNSGVPTSGASRTGSFHNWTPAADRVCHPTLAAYTSSSGATGNFGQRPFAYTAPSGFKALCTTNLPTPAIGASSTTLADDYFNVVTYTGTGSSLSVTGVGFQPDLVWIKGRSGATDHALYDAVRGVQKQLESNTTTAETTETTGLTAFGTDGFTVGTLAQLNTNTATYVGWAWKANGAGSSNTSGSISSTVSANQTAGISVVTYTGTGAAATIGHGLGKAPSMIITKQRNGTWLWMSYHVALGATKYVYLNATDAQATDAQTYASAPTSTVWSVGTNGQINGNTSTYVAYCFAEVAGFSKFGSYTGNGSADGPFVYCGFRPRWILLKRYDTGSSANWELYDTSRDPYNQAVNRLAPSLSDAESATFALGDILSNGFKIRQTDQTWNASGGTYIFAAFGESPFNYARAR